MLVLHTCASTRDVILELVPEASSKCFIYSLRKFISRRGCPGRISTIWDSFHFARNEKLAKNRNIEWQFSLSNTPWYGCFSEQLVSIVKLCLKETVGKACLNFN